MCTTLIGEGTRTSVMWGETGTTQRKRNAITAENNVYSEDMDGWKAVRIIHGEGMKMMRGWNGGCKMYRKWRWTTTRDDPWNIPNGRQSIEGHQEGKNSGRWRHPYYRTAMASLWTHPIDASAANKYNAKRKKTNNIGHFTTGDKTNKAIRTKV
eukprot:Opistho-2@44337